MSMKIHKNDTQQIRIGQWRDGRTDAQNEQKQPVQPLQWHQMDSIKLMWMYFSFYSRNIRISVRMYNCTIPKHLNVSRLVLQLSCPIHWSQVLSREWRCSWSSPVRWCFKYIWVISKMLFILEVWWYVSYLYFASYLLFLCESPESWQTSAVK